MSTAVQFNLNGEPVRVDADRGATLLNYLREDRRLTGTRNGCGAGQCGSCTVLVDGAVRTACTTRLADLEGRSVETIEALASGGSLHPIQQAFIDEGAVQCGFCIPGMVMATKALLNTNPAPTEEDIRQALDPNLCRCTGYSSIVRAVQRAAGVPVTPPARDGAFMTGDNSGVTTKPEHTTVGTSVVRTDAVPKVMGAPIFAEDFFAESMLHGALAFSEHHHAHLTAVDVTAAEALPGVVRVFTARDIPGRNGFGLQFPHQPVLADHVVRYRGEPIAFVVAETRLQARRAAALVRGTYEPLPVLHDPEEALADDAPRLHEDQDNTYGKNIAEEVRFRRGDPEKAFAEADLVIEGEYTTQCNEHAYLEPESCLALPGSPGSAGPVVTIRTTTQGSGAYQRMIAASLAVPDEAIRVIFTPAGGGFGGKEEPTVQIHACLAAMTLGRPVKVTLDRADSLRISTKRHASRIRIRHAVKSDGTLMAVETRTVCDAGAYLSLTRPVVFRTAVMAGGPYEVPNADVESIGVYTNTNPSGAFRGFGSTQISFAVEMQMDRISRALGIDPIELRRRNALGAGKVTVTGHRLGSGVGYPGTIRAVAEALEEARHEIHPAPGKKLGIGFASAYKNVGIGKGMPDEASAAAEIASDGTVTVYVGATDIGQGSDTVMAQIAAEMLNVPYDRVQVVSSDTELCPDAGMTTASRQTFVSGNAVAGAAGLLRDRLARGEEAPFRVEYRYRPPATVKLPEVCADDTAENPAGFPIHFAYCYTSMAAIIEINPDGTEMKVLKLITAQDAGRALHPGNVLGQVEGAAVMGYGFGVREEYRCGRTGRATATLNSLGIPRFSDSPATETYIVEEIDPNGPFGAKGIGEIPLNPAAPAIASAIHDAIGVYIHSLPLAPEGNIHGG